MIHQQGLESKGEAMTSQATSLKEGACGALGIVQAAKYLGISRPTLYRILADNSLPSLHIGARHLLRVTDLDAFLTARVEA